MTPLPSRLKEELNILANDIYCGRVFTNYNCRPEEARMVFMPLAFRDKEELMPILENARMIYEYLDKAGPRSCNGLPMFMSCSFLNAADTHYVLNLIQKLSTAFKEVTEEACTKTP